MDHQQKAGVLLFVGSAQFVVGMVVAEAMYPGYSASLNYISDLGDSEITPHPIQLKTPRSPIRHDRMSQDLAQGKTRILSFLDD